jgi:anti-sigma factor RsiW
MKRHNCGLSEEHITAFAQGELEPDRATRVARHVIACPDCSELLGRLKAADALLELPATEHQPQQPSQQFWARLSAHLDDVDQVVRATPAISNDEIRRPNTSRIHRLAIAAAVLIVLAVAAQQLLLNRPSAADPAQLLIVHHQALGGSSSGHVAVSMSAAAKTGGSPRPFAVFELNGTPAISFLHNLAGRATTITFMAPGSISLRQLHPLQENDRRYWAASVGDGTTLLLDTEGPVWQAIISDAPPRQIFWLLNHTSPHTASSPSM